MRIRILMVVVMAFVLCGGIAIVGAAEKTLTPVAGKAQDPVDLSRYKVTKAVSPFSHARHIERKVECATCHHKAKDGRSDVKCSACHQTETVDKVISAKDAFHDQCRGCHQKSNKAAPTSKAPTRCTDCHR